MTPHHERHQNTGTQAGAEHHARITFTARTAAAYLTRHR